MSQVTIEVNGRPYVVGCEDGQEAHLIELARHFDRQVTQVGQQVGQLGESRLFLMGALLLADELADARSRLAETQGQAARQQADVEQMQALADELAATRARLAETQDEVARQQAEARRIQAHAAGAIEMAARKIEALAAPSDT